MKTKNERDTHMGLDGVDGRGLGGVRVSVIPGGMHARACVLETRLDGTAYPPAVLHRTRPMDQIFKSHADARKRWRN
jgi:hypothetical protein